MKKYVIGIDFGTLSGRSVLVDLETGSEVAASVMEYPHGVMDVGLPCGVKLDSDSALQDPRDYMEVLEHIVTDMMKCSKVAPESVVGIGIDFTSSTVLPVYQDGTPLCYTKKYQSEPHAYVKLWKHHAAQEQADIMEQCAQKKEWLKRYGGKVSAEWMLPKIVEILQKREDIYWEAGRFVEAGDWIVWQLTGKEVHSLCMAGYKAFWCKEEGYPSNQFFREVDSRLNGIVGTKLSEDIIPTGSRAGTLTKEMAARLGLSENTVVAAAVIDAHAALPAQGIVGAGEMLLIMGTSTCHIVMDEREHLIPGISGVVKDGIVPGYYAYEAGQSAVGDLFDWFIKNCVPKTYFEEGEREKKNIHEFLQEKAEQLPPGSNGLIALDWWNGNRSILSNAKLSGTIFGLNLGTKPEEIYRALLEATAYGTKVIVDAYGKSGLEIREVYAAGGIPTKNALIMQIYADVLDIPIKVAAKSRSSALGSAIFASVAAGCFESIRDAVERLVDKEMICYEPDPDHVKAYEKVFALYKEMHEYFGVKNREFMERLKG